MADKKRNPKGMGSFTKNADGSITHRKSIGRTVEGKRKVLTVTAANKTQAIKLMKEKEKAWEEEKAKQSLEFHSSITIEELCKKHLEYQISNNELTNKSWDRRETTIKNHISVYPLGKMQLQAVTAKEIDAHILTLMSEGKLSASSIQKALDVLNAAFKWGITRGNLSFNPVESIRPSLIKRISKMKQKNANDEDVLVLSDEEIKKFLETCFIRDKKTGTFNMSGLYGAFLLYTGLRVGEFISLKWSDINLESGILIVDKSSSIVKNRETNHSEERNYIAIIKETKNQKARKIKLLPEALNVLELIKQNSANIEANDLICTTRTGKANTATNLEHRMKKIYRDAGIFANTGSLHILRRTFATQRYREGVPTKAIASYLGDLESTVMKYYITAREKVVIDGEVHQIVDVSKKIS